MTPDERIEKVMDKYVDFLSEQMKKPDASLLEINDGIRLLERNRYDLKQSVDAALAKISKNGRKSESFEPTITEHSVMGGSKDMLQITRTILRGLMENLKGDNFKLVIEVADGTFTVNRYPME